MPKSNLTFAQTFVCHLLFDQVLPVCALPMWCGGNNPTVTDCSHLREQKHIVVCLADKWLLRAAVFHLKDKLSGLTTFFAVRKTDFALDVMDIMLSISSRSSEASITNVAVLRRTCPSKVSEQKNSLFSVFCIFEHVGLKERRPSAFIKMSPMH